MMSNNKVLTVSYGTFSCTLEGFDDSFGTMKAIAEYFRDLASDDRYFGAEPPQPDAEMLARIAEKEIARRVQASLDGGRVVLSAAPAAVSATEKAGDAEPENEAPRDDAPADTAPADRREVAVVSETSEAPETSDAPDMVTEPEVAQNTAPDIPAEAQDAPASAPGIDPEKDPETDAESPARDAEADDAAQNAPVAAEAESPQAPEDSAHPHDMPEAEDVAPAAMAGAAALGGAAAGSSIADKLARIRAVVARSEAEAEEAAYTEDEHAEELPADTAELADLIEDAVEDDEADDETPAAEAATEDTPAAEAATEDDTPQADTDDGTPDDTAPFVEEVDRAAEAKEEPQTAEAPAPAQPEDAETEQEPPAEAETAGAALAAGDAEEAPAAAQSGSADDTPAAAETDGTGDTPDAAEIVEIETAADGDDDDDIAAILARLSAEAEDDAPEAAPIADAAHDDAAQDDAATEGDIAAEQTPRTAPPRVIKIKRADLEAAIAAGQLEEVAGHEDEAEDPDTEDRATSLSPEDEADLMRELAAVEAELPIDPPEAESDDQGAAETEEPVAEEVEETPAASSETPAAQKQPEADVDRLMAKADVEMDEPEGAKNRNAFAHLKAAVAARKGDAGIDNDDGEAEEGRYRNDLAAVVKPRRPRPRDTGRDARPQAKPAPLKLVAEQRVDLPEGAPDSGPDSGPDRGPVRPRRVSSTPEPMQNSDGGFADYAEDLGAHGLPQLLEAAAAYLAFVENRETFSRPQIMSKVRTAQGGGFSREDGLRSFGQLLRAGKIEKLKGGRFAATGETGFRPDTRAAS